MVNSNGGNGKKDYNPKVEFEYVDADVWYEVDPQTGERIDVTYTEEILDQLENPDEEDSSSESE